MSDPALALQDAIEATLTAYAPLQAIGTAGKVVIHTMSAPNGAAFPYVVIGEDQVLDDSTECLDGSEVYSTVHCWARASDDPENSRRETKAMAAAIRQALKTITVPGFDVVLIEFDSARHLTAADGLTAHAVLTFRLLLDPV
ncbi:MULTISPECIES: DUF3168 domain-containing protein [unclassified Brevundimonas]|uniref:DUF3168 domain-containing protein n=1 Tax=unclassified Brevundimonas TaxID=2622653 RepID=UPI0014304F7C|nr:MULTISPECIES: DUF3168 domain-containing protein [unclassified Brevundimonas]